MTLGLIDPDIDIDGELTRMHPIRNNAAWRVCLGMSVEPGHVPPLADLRYADQAPARHSGASRI